MLENLPKMEYHLVNDHHKHQFLQHHQEMNFEPIGLYNNKKIKNNKIKNNDNNNIKILLDQ